MLRVKGYRYKKAGRERKEVYLGITWKFYIIHSLSTLEILYVRVASALSIQTFTDPDLSGRGRWGNEDRGELTV